MMGSLPLRPRQGLLAHAGRGSRAHAQRSVQNAFHPACVDAAAASLRPLPPCPPACVASTSSRPAAAPLAQQAPLSSAHACLRRQARRPSLHLAASGSSTAGDGWQQPNSQGGGEGDPSPEALDPQEHGGMPKVPWGSAKIFQVMALWLLAYVIIGQVALPIALSLLGIDRDAMSIRGHALLHLSLDMSQLGMTLLILWQTLKKYRPRALGFFPVKFKGWWPLAVLLGCAAFPLVDYVAHQSIILLPMEADGWGGQMEASLSVGDWITNVAYFSVVSICAPIWEEAIFRGFLLTSMTRYMPTYLAAGASSLLFAMCHFRHQTFLPLLMLGSVFSAIYIKTRNLIPPIVLHSLWNVYVMASLIRGNGVY